MATEERNIITTEERGIVTTEERHIPFLWQEEQRQGNIFAQDDASTQDVIRHDASVEATEARQAQEQELAKLRERERKLAFRGQQDEQRRRDRQARDESAMGALLRHKAIAEDGKAQAAERRKAQDAENYLLREEQRMAKQRAREQKQKLRDQQDEQRRLDRQARDEAGMRALLRHEAAVKAKKVQEAEERKLAKLRETARLEQEHELARLEKERIADERRLAAESRPIKQRRMGQEESSCGERGGRHPVEERDPGAEPRGSGGRPRLSAAQIDDRQALWRLQEEQRRRDREARGQASLEALACYEAATKAERAQKAEERRLARVQEKGRVAEERRQAKLGEKERVQSFCVQQDQCEGESQGQVEPSIPGRPRLTSAQIDERQTARHMQDEQRRENKRRRDEAGMQAIRRHNAALQAQKTQQKSLAEGRIVAFDGVLPSFLDEEYQYMKQASADFPEEITSDIQMRCMKDYQRAISDASRRLPCGICGGLFQEDEMVIISRQADDLQYFLQRTKTAPDCCAVNDDTVGLCTTCNSAIAKRAIPPLSAGNFVNCLFCQDYPEALKNLNTVEEAFIARAHVVGIFLKLTSGAKGGVSYRGSRGHSVAVRQDPSELLKILPTARLRDHTTITVSWDRGTPPSEENLARFCSVDKAKVVNALLWLCAHNPGYKSVVVDYSLLDSWPDHHIPQEIRDAFITLGSEPGSTDTPVEDEREGYATSLQDGLFENELDAEVEDAEPGSILSRSFFSDLHGQDLHSTPATLATLQAILQEQDPDRSELVEDDAVDVRDDEESAPKDSSRLPHISYKTTQHLTAMSAFTDPDYFTAAFPTLFPYGIGGHLGDVNGDRPEEVSLKAFARYTMLHHSLLFSQHHTFMFYLYDLILIRQASFGNHVQVKNGYWAKATHELSRLSADDLQRAAQEFTDGKKISNPAIHSLITNMRIISSFNPESFGEKMKFRNLIFGKIARFGIPLIWFTLNPKDIGNIFVVRLSGEEISLDEPGITSKLLQLTIKNPSLVAQFFHVVVTSFFARATHPYLVRRLRKKGSKRASTTADGHGTAQRVSTSYRGSKIGSVCLWTGKRNS